MEKLKIKHRVILIILLFIGAFLYIIISNITSDNEKEKVLKEYNKQQKLVLSDSSTIESMIEIPEETNVKSTLEYDKEQIYFKDIEILYDYYNFDEVNKIKMKVQKFIHSYISKDILDCTIVKESIYKNDGVINFNILLENNNVINVEMLKNKDILDITIQYN